MSSDAGSLKKAADEVAKDEPSSKKVKIAEPEGKVVESAESGNKSASGDIAKSNNNNDNHSKTPSKVLNGSAKLAEGSSDLNQAHGGDDGDDCEELDGAEADGVFDSEVTTSLSEAEIAQREICNLNEKASEEILKVEQKFNKLRRPHFEKRNELLKAVPSFWVQAMTNHPIISPMIDSREEEDLLQYLENLDVEEFDDIKSGYKLKLQFKENPYITNDVIVKQFQVISSEEVSSVVSPPIDYKSTPEGQKLKQIVQESIERARRFRRPDNPPSFFAWLSESSESGNDEVAETIKDQIWPNPLEYFFAPNDDNDYATSDDEDEEIDDEELDDEDDCQEVVGIDGEFSDEDIEGEDDEEEDLDEEGDVE